MSSVTVHAVRAQLEMSDKADDTSWFVLLKNQFQIQALIFPKDICYVKYHNNYFLKLLHQALSFQCL